MDGLTTFKLNNLLKGPCNVLYADPSDVEPPDNIADIFDPDGNGYELVEGWKVFGATTAGTAYSRQFTTQGYQIEQATGNVDEDVTDAVRAVQLTAGEISADVLAILEQSAPAKPVEKAKGRAPELQIRTGTVESLANYRVAFVGRRLVGKGADVTESGGKVRGAFVVGGLWTAKITGDQAAIQVARGQLASAPLTLQAYIDDTQDEGEEHGFWFLEQSATIEAAS